MIEVRLILWLSSVSVLKQKTSPSTVILMVNITMFDIDDTNVDDDDVDEDDDADDDDINDGSLPNSR